MHQNAFGGRAPPGPAGGAKALPPDPLAPIRGPTSKGRGRGGKGRRGRREGEGKGRGEGREREGKGRGGRGLAPSPEKNFWRRHCQSQMGLTLIRI